MKKYIVIFYIICFFSLIIALFVGVYPIFKVNCKYREQISYGSLLIFHLSMTIMAYLKKKTDILIMGIFFSFLLLMIFIM